MNVKASRSACALCNVPVLLCYCFPLHSVVTLAFLARSDSNGPLVSTETCRGVYRDCSAGAAPRPSRCCVLQLSGLMRREALGRYKIIISLVTQCHLASAWITAVIKLRSRRSILPVLVIVWDLVSIFCILCWKASSLGSVGLSSCQKL